MQPVLEVYPPDGFALWPVAEAMPSGFLVLSGELTPYSAEIGAHSMVMLRTVYSVITYQ